VGGRAGKNGEEGGSPSVRQHLDAVDQALQGALPVGQQRLRSQRRCGNVDCDLLGVSVAQVHKHMGDKAQAQHGQKSSATLDTSQPRTPTHIASTDTNAPSQHGHQRTQQARTPTYPGSRCRLELGAGLGGLALRLHAVCPMRLGVAAQRRHPRGKIGNPLPLTIEILASGRRIEMQQWVWGGYVWKSSGKQ
jgi:hypothetical protein